MRESTDGSGEMERTTSIPAPDIAAELASLRAKVTALEALQTAPRARRAGVGRSARRRLVRIGLTVCLLTLAMGTNALASVPDPSGVIHGCYLKSLGSVRIIDTDTDQHCTRLEAAITWNQTGPAGVPGPQGPVGAIGPVGPQ